MLFKIASASLAGIDAYRVDVEVDVNPGIPHFVIVGLPDTAVRESKERVKTALKNCGFSASRCKIIVNLAPADRRKEGSAYDLPIALGILAHLEAFPPQRLSFYLFSGELALDGRLKSGKGLLAATVLAKKMGYQGVVLPRDNAREAALVQGIDVFALKDMGEVINLLRQPELVSPIKIPDSDMMPQPVWDVDFDEIKGQYHAKRALEVAAAGGHNVLMIGPPGSGKTMLARRLVSILPPMTFDEILEVTRIYSASGLLRDGWALIERPFRDPHHTISAAGLVGGGLIPKPGEVSLAHRGVLFLDELPEFRKQALESLRQPLEDGRVSISRTSMSVTYPADFMLVTAMNPCEDVWDGLSSIQYDCSPQQRFRYYSKLSRPLIDRIDIQIQVPRVEFKDMLEHRNTESSAVIRDRVIRARRKQLTRLQPFSLLCNAQMRNREVKSFCAVSKATRELLQTAVERLGFSARAFHRVLKVARTIADLADVGELAAEHVSEAIQYRVLDKKM